MTTAVKNQAWSMPIIKVIAWPILFVILFLLTLLWFKGQIAPKEMQLNSKGIRISFYLLEAAERERSGTATKSAPNVREIQKTAKRGSAVSLEGAQILWVDDNPENNQYERKALEALGVQFTLATNTDEALLKLSNQPFQLVITDFKRADDERAGYTLLMATKKLTNPPPVIIYSAGTTPQLAREA